MTPSVTEAQIITTLGGWLTGLFSPAIPVFQGQGNRVPEPSGTDFVVMTPLRRERLATNCDSWDETNPAPTTLSVATAMQVTFQIDVHGPASGDNVQTIVTLWRDEIAVDAFAASGFALAPLFASEPMQLPFLNAEQQYEERWTVDLVCQANVVLTPSQQFADALDVTLEQAD